MIDVLIDAASSDVPFACSEAANGPRLSRNDSSRERLDATIERAAAETLAALVPGVVSGLVIGAVIAAPAPTRGMREIADAAGCGLADARALDLAPVPGASPYLLLLRAGSAPQGEWIADLRRVLAEADMHRRNAPGRPFLGRLRQETALAPSGPTAWARSLARRLRPATDGILVSRADLGGRSFRSVIAGHRGVRLRAGLLVGSLHG